MLAVEQKHSSALVRIPCVRCLGNPSWKQEFLLFSLPPSYFFVSLEHVVYWPIVLSKTRNVLFPQGNCVLTYACSVHPSLRAGTGCLAQHDIHSKCRVQGVQSKMRRRPLSASSGGRKKVFFFFWHAGLSPSLSDSIFLRRIFQCC